MKIIHTADVHIGSAIKNLPNGKARARRQEGFTAFAYLVQYAKDRQVSAVLICGDLFDEASVSQSVIRQTFDIIAAAPEIAFFYCQGNHDKGTVFNGELPKNLFLFGDAHGWKSYALGENIVITGADSEYLSADEYARLQLSKTAYNIVVAHGEISTVSGKDRVCLPLLQNKGIDYLALGHIHNPAREMKKLDARGSYRYSGSLFSRGFDECGQKGFYEIEIKGGRMLSEVLVTIPTVRAVNAYMVDVSACQTSLQLEEKICAALQGARTQDIVKIVLKGRLQSSLKKYVYPIESAFNDKFFYCQLVDQTTVALGENERISRSPLLAEFSRILDSRPELASQKQELLDVACNALNGENL